MPAYVRKLLLDRSDGMAQQKRQADVRDLGSVLGGGGAVRSGNPKPLTTRVFGSGSLFSAVLVA